MLSGNPVYDLCTVSRMVNGTVSGVATDMVSGLVSCQMIITAYLNFSS